MGGLDEVQGVKDNVSVYTVVQCVRSHLAQAFWLKWFCSRPCGLGEVGKGHQTPRCSGLLVGLTSFVISRCSVIT